MSLYFYLSRLTVFAVLSELAGMRERQMNIQAVSEDEQVDKGPRLDG